MLPEVLARLHSTIGGSRDTELKLFAVRPTSLPSTPRVVTMVTPVANAPRAMRSAWGSVFESGGTMGPPRAGASKDLTDGMNRINRIGRFSHPVQAADEAR